MVDGGDSFVTDTARRHSGSNDPPCFERSATSNLPPISRGAGNAKRKIDFVRDLVEKLSWSNAKVAPLDLEFRPNDQEVPRSLPMLKSRSFPSM